MNAPALGLLQFAPPGFSLASIESLAQVAIERVIHSLPEGVLIALFAWVALRVLPKQNSRTRFAVWFTTLLAVVGIGCVGESWIASQLPHSNVAKDATLGWGTLGGIHDRVLFEGGVGAGQVVAVGSEVDHGAEGRTGHWACFDGVADGCVVFV